MDTRKRRFVEEYLKDLNITKAAERAGYSAKTAASQGSRLLKNVKIQAEIERLQQKRSERTGITQDRVLKELELLAFSDLTHYAVDDNGDVTLADGAPAGAMRSLSSIKRRITTRGSGETREVTREVELKLWDKPTPLKLAGQHVGLFAELGDKGRPMHGLTRVTFGGRYRPDSEKSQKP